MGFLASILAGPLVNGAIEIFKDFQKGKIDEAKLRDALLSMMIRTIGDIIKTQASVIIAEIRGPDWLQRNWRPIVGLTAFFSIFFVIIIIPLLVAWADVTAPSFGEKGLGWFFDMTMLGLGGYVGFKMLGKLGDKVIGAVEKGRR